MGWLIFIVAIMVITFLINASRETDRRLIRRRGSGDNGDPHIGIVDPITATDGPHRHHGLDLDGDGAWGDGDSGDAGGDGGGDGGGGDGGGGGD
jgi:hypothetical protein